MSNPSQPVNRERNDGLPVRRLLMALRKHWWLAVSTLLVVSVATTFYTLGQTPVYRTGATLLIDPDPPRPLGADVKTAVDMGSGVYWTNKEYYKTQFELIKSRRLAHQTVTTLQLHRDSEFMTGRKGDEKAQATDASVETAVDTLLERLIVEPVRDTRLVSVSLEDSDPERANRVLSAHLDLYMQQNLDDALTSTTSAADWMEDQLQKLKTELEDKEIGLHEYKKDKRILSVSIDDQSNMLRNEMQLLSDELTRVRAEREAVSSRVDILKSVDPEEPENLPAREFISNLVLNELRAHYIQAKRDHASLSASGKGEKHPELLAAAASLKESRGALMAEIRNVQQAQERDLVAINQQVGGLTGLFENVKQRALDLNLLGIQYGRLERSKKNTERLFSLVLERSKDSDLTSQMRFNNIKLVDRPRASPSPVRPRVPLNIALGITFGLILGLVVAVGREAMDRTIKSPEDVESDLGITLVGILPHVEPAGSGWRRPYSKRREKERNDAQQAIAPELVVHRFSSSVAAEAARAIRTNILFMSPDKPFKTILVTSPLAAEGKTTVACSLAIAMAQAGQRVLLVDADLRRPRIHRIFRLPADRGLTNLILNPENLEATLYETEIANLTVLAAGLVPPNPADLLQSEAFSRLLSQLEAPFDRIVIDSPPLVPVTDAAVLATRASATLLVVKPFKTTKEVARQAIRAVRDVGANLIGSVINNVDVKSQGYGYYYQYYHRRDDYSSNSTPPAS